MNVIKIKELINVEQTRLENSNSPANSSNIIFNLLKLYSFINDNSDNYILIKKFVKNYILSLEDAKFGYDNISIQKYCEVLNYANDEEKIGIINFTLSLLSSHLPDYNKSWLIELLHKSEIKHIIKNKNYRQFHKVILLYSASNIWTLFLTSLIISTIIIFILLPANTPKFELFDIQYDVYCDNFFVNHILNVLTLLVGVENQFKIIPLNILGVILAIILKLMYVVLIVNFVFIKVIDKINFK